MYDFIFYIKNLFIFSWFRGEMLTAKKESTDDSDKEDTIDIIGDKISSDSENDDSGFMDKIKDEVADALGI